MDFDSSGDSSRIVDANLFFSGSKESASTDRTVLAAEDRQTSETQPNEPPFYAEDYRVRAACDG